MTPRPRSNSGDDTPGGPSGSGPHRHGGNPSGGGGVRSNEAAALATAHQGRAGNGPAATPADIARGQPDHLFTHMTGTPGGTPTGPLTVVRSGGDPTNGRSDELENSGAAKIADSGYRIHQNPTPEQVARARADTGDTGRPTKNPDFLIEGRVFDCYSPTKANKPVRGIWDEAEDKVNKGQTQRVVVNLEDWRGDLGALQRQFDNWPIPGLKELKVITPHGEIIQINLPDENYRG
jgi:hypothetical protein